jgi:hypothetical protein
MSGYTPAVTPTITLTPSITLTRTVDASGQATFQMLDETFSCVSVKVLTDCTSGTEYYVTNNLVYLGVPVVTGMTMLVDIAGGLHCVTYTSDKDNMSSDNNVGQIYQLYSICGNCNVYPTPTPTVTATATSTPTQTQTKTPTNTPTNTATPTTTATAGSTPPPTPNSTLTPTPTNTTTSTLTPTPSTTPNYVYVYESCQPISPNVLKTQVIQNVKTSLTLLVGQCFKFNGICWTYLGRFETGYTATTVFPVTSSVDFFVGINNCIYSTCSVCLSESIQPNCLPKSFPEGTTFYSVPPVPARTSTSIAVVSAVLPPQTNCGGTVSPLTVRRIYYSPTNNPPLLTDPYISLPLVYNVEIEVFITGLTPNTGYWIATYAETLYATCYHTFIQKVSTTS